MTYIKHKLHNNQQFLTDRQIKRRFKTMRRKGRVREENLGKEYTDNLGNPYPNKIAAMISSFGNIVSGCMLNGFPIVVSKLWYNAWAFYPFFFVKKQLPDEYALPTLNHERIHVRQQRDIHLTISLPLLILLGYLELFGKMFVLPYLCVIPFIPTLIYGFEMLRTWFVMQWKWGTNQSTLYPNWKNVRENTCFEREAISKATNYDYLIKGRKIWAVIAYTGIKWFNNYGIK